jgi:hypothetical protein
VDGQGAAGERNYIDYCIDYNMANSPLPKPLFADDVGRSALALCSELSGVRPIDTLSLLPPALCPRPPVRFVP